MPQWHSKHNNYDNDGMSECKGWIFNIATQFFKRRRNFNLSKVDLVHDFLIDCVRWLAAKVFSVQTFECQANVDLDNLLTNFTMLLMIKQNQCWSWKFKMICTFASVVALSVVALFSEQFLQNAKRYWQKFATY